MQTFTRAGIARPAVSLEPFVVRRLENQVSKATTDEALPRCYLSAFDTLIDCMALYGETGEIHQAAPVSTVARDYLVDGDTQKPIIVHLGWRAKRYRVLQRPGGRLVGLGYLQTACPAAEEIAIEVQALATMHTLFESTGLYAWREAHRVIASRNLALIASQALNAVCKANPDNQTNVDNYDQIAMFDSESCEWHFLPRNHFPNLP